jgi:hypothetical protein
MMADHEFAPDFNSRELEAIFEETANACLLAASADG